MGKMLVWFRQDLRVQDNPALAEAARSGEVVPVYIEDTNSDNPWPMGGASKWWLYKSLFDLRAEGVPLLFRKGDPQTVLTDLMQQYECEEVFWNRLYTPYEMARDAKIKEHFQDRAHSFNGALLFEPWQVQNKQGEYYKVFTPFWRHCREMPEPRDPIHMPHVTYAAIPKKELGDIMEGYAPPRWAEGFEKEWSPGSSGAHNRLAYFAAEYLTGYKKGRDLPGTKGTSRLSPYLHFGNISPFQVWHKVMPKTRTAATVEGEGVRTFLSEMGWREFAHHLLYHVPHLPEAPFKKEFEQMPWRDDPDQLKAWQKGQTGYPIIDAGMRELWHTGYMHNRVRMIVASFLTKHCLLHWRKGEEWFWDTLLDADLANNAAGWQWVAGSGADAAPYFRVFNPVLQSKKFDAEGAYIRKWVPEVAGFSNQDIHAPYETSETTQKKAKCVIGKEYPAPIVDLQGGRDRALGAYDYMK